jgi:pheromone a factor receptor
MIFAASTIHSFNKRRTQFKASLSHNNVNSGRYFRLMGLASLDLCCTIPIASYIIFQSTQDGGYQPWISWKVTHAGFDQIQQIPAIIWRSDPTARVNLEMSRGLNIACALVFFIFFGFAEEARKNYWSAYTSVAKRVGYSTGSMSSGGTSTLGYVLLPR